MGGFGNKVCIFEFFVRCFKIELFRLIFNVYIVEIILSINVLLIYFIFC